MESLRKYLVILFFIFVNTTCSGQTDFVPEQVPYHPNPEIPSQKALNAVTATDFDDLTEKKEVVSSSKTIRYYYQNEQLFSGWVLKIFSDTEHRFRYMKIDKGLIVWQIGFYDNGDLDFDFHHKDGHNVGSQRMWRKAVEPYIDTYFQEGGIQHGPQYRWHGKGVLARDALFENGQLVYEVLFDQQGEITQKTGDLPPKYFHEK